MSSSNFSFVNYLWDEAHAAKLDPVARLIYRSNLLGSDQRITNTGGGNTSAKIEETDPLTGRPVTVLWVKGSGGDLRTSKWENFSSLYQDKLLALQDRYAAAKERGPKTSIEDDMVEMYLHATFNLNPRAPSIDTPLHSFIPARHVDHTHPNAVIAIAAAKNSKELTKKIYGDEVIWTPWQRPGFDLGLQLQKICRENPKAKGIILGQHGLINWADDDKACYELSLTLIEKAARYLDTHDQGAKTFGGAKFESLPEAERRATLAKLLPWLRGRVSQKRRFIGTWQDDEATLAFVNSAHAPRLAELGTSCPDHFLRTKIKPLYIDWNPQNEKIDALKKKLETGLENYRKDYAAYYEKCKHANSPAVRDANPTVVLVPGLGLIAWGKDKSESRVTAEFYGCAIQVMRGAEAVDSYTALPLQEAFDIEYWLLEEAKLQRMPAEKELARQIIAVVGAGSGIGREVALRLVKEGAHVVAIDLNPAGVEATAKEITDKHGLGIGVAGSGISGCGPAVAVSADVTKRESIRAALEQAVLAYGGIDSIAVTAGIFVPPDTAGNIADEKWALTFAINVTGAYLVADEARPLWAEQGLRGSLVLTTSANAVVAKKGSVAYDTSKAAANHLVRELAVELSPLVRVNGVAPATVIQGSAMFPRDRVIASLAKYKIPYKNDEPSESLTAKLAQFYADRTLTKNPITPADQAEAIFLLLTNRLGKTTGQVITVDGGLHEAFLKVKVSLFIPCFIDQFYPQVGVSMVQVLERLGCEVDYPPGQTCCGQPPFNSGYWNEARAVAERALKTFAESETIVGASGSCGAMMKVFYPELFKDTEQEFAARKFASKVHEFSEFLVNILGVRDVGARFSGTATFHDGCHGLRELGIKREPRELLKHVQGLELVEITEAETCCGFGGTFAVKFPAISTAMGEVKCASIEATRAEYVISNDSSCLMQIQGLLDRQGQKARCLHLAEILART